MALTIPNIETGPAFDAQSVPDATDWNATTLAETGAAGVLNGGAVTPSSGMTVAVADGWVVVNGATYSLGGGGTTTVGANSGASGDRKDIVVWTVGTGLQVIAGTPCGVSAWTRSNSNFPPVKPAIPANSVILAEVYVAYNTTTISSNNLIDKTTLVNSPPQVLSVANLVPLGTGTITASVQIAQNSTHSTYTVEPIDLDGPISLASIGMLLTLGSTSFNNSSRNYTAALSLSHTVLVFSRTGNTLSQLTSTTAGITLSLTTSNGANITLSPIQSNNATNMAFDCVTGLSSVELAAGRFWLAHRIWASGRFTSNMTSATTSSGTVTLATPAAYMAVLIQTLGPPQGYILPGTNQSNSGAAQVLMGQGTLTSAADPTTINITAPVEVNSHPYFYIAESIT